MKSTKNFKVRQISLDSLISIEAKYNIEILQQPSRARACGIARSSARTAVAGRRTVDPPPVVRVSLKDRDNSKINIIERNVNQLVLVAQAEPVSDDNSSTATRSEDTAVGFYDDDDEDEKLRKRKKRLPNSKGLQKGEDLLYGETVVSAFIINPQTTDFDNFNNELDDMKGFFVFSDLSVRYEGNYRLNFLLFEYPFAAFSTSARDEQSQNLGSKLLFRGAVKSSVFKVYTAKDFPGLAPSTKLDFKLKNLGSNIRIRRTTGTKRGSVGSRRVRRNSEDTDCEKSPKSEQKSLGCAKGSPKENMQRKDLLNKHHRPDISRQGSASSSPKISNLLNFNIEQPKEQASSDTSSQISSNNHINLPGNPHSHLLPHQRLPPLAVCQSLSTHFDLPQPTASSLSSSQYSSPGSTTPTDSRSPMRIPYRSVNLPSLSSISKASLPFTSPAVLFSTQPLPQVYQTTRSGILGDSGTFPPPEDLSVSNRVDEKKRRYSEHNFPATSIPPIPHPIPYHGIDLADTKPFSESSVLPPLSSFANIKNTQQHNSSNFSGFDGFKPTRAHLNDHFERHT